MSPLLVQVELNSDQKAYMPIYMILFSAQKSRESPKSPITSRKIDFKNKPNKVMTLKKINEIFGEIFKRSETRTKYDHNTGWN